MIWHGMSAHRRQIGVKPDTMTCNSAAFRVLASRAACASELRYARGDGPAFTWPTAQDGTKTDTCCGGQLVEMRPGASTIPAGGNQMGSIDVLVIRTPLTCWCANLHAQITFVISVFFIDERRRLAGKRDCCLSACLGKLPQEDHSEVSVKVWRRVAGTPSVQGGCSLVDTLAKLLARNRRVQSTLAAMFV